MLSYLPEIWITLMGLCIGSFLNVCIYRLPSGQTIADPPRSQCPDCGHPIRFYDNIPVISFLMLGGRCRSCSKPISLRYPTVESLSALFALAAYMKFGFSAEALIYYVFISALLVVTFIDIDHQIIPNVISLPGIPLFFLASFVERHHIGFFKILPDRVAPYAIHLPVPVMTLNAVLGIVAGGGILYLVAWGYFLLTRKEGMGGGDIKLLAMIGALIGWEGVLFTIFVGSAVGTLAGVVLLARYRMVDTKLRIPFGPFLSTGAILYVFFGSKLIFWYFRMMA